MKVINFLATSFVVLGFSVPAYAVGIGNPDFDEIGNDVKVTFDLDNRFGGYENLPDMFDIDITLFENDLIFDDNLGKQTIWLKKNDVTPTTGGGWRKFDLMLTFKNASNAYTGYGNDYFLTASEPYQSVPEPATILGTTTALGFGTLLKRRNSKKQNKS